MIKQTERLKTIYLFLKQNPADAQSLLEYLKNNNAEISLRQLQRDLVDVENNFLQISEKLMVKTVQHRKKIWQIVITKNQVHLNQSTINTLYLSILVSPNVFLEKRSADIDLFKKIIKQTIIDGQNKLTINHKQTQFINTHFYEVTKDDVFNQNIDQLIEAVMNRKYIKIIKLINDYTVDNFQLEDIIFNFAPVEILYHRGTFLVAGIKNGKKDVVIYEVGQLKQFAVLDRGFNFDLFSKNIKFELHKRFGITKNINNYEYDIELEFTAVTGALVSKFFWHETQQFKKINVGNWKMTLRCGINRELLGWLLQWMYNVRIIEPQILIEKYDHTLKEMISNRQNEKAFVYRNIFEPK